MEKQSTYFLCICIRLCPDVAAFIVTSNNPDVKVKENEGEFWNSNMFPSPWKRIGLHSVDFSQNFCKLKL